VHVATLGGVLRFTYALLANVRKECKIVRTMRKSPPLLTPLFSRTMQGVLSATLLRPEREWYQSDLASHLGVRPSSLQRVLAQLTRAGILQRRADGNRVYYRADATCPIHGDLASILIKTIGVAEPLREVLAPLANGIRVAFIHGSVAEMREQSQSDVDLIIVGDLPNSEVAFALRPMQGRLGRDVRFTRYTPKEFAAKRASGHHFLAAVMQRPRIFLIGDEHELDEVAGRQTRGS